MCKDIMISDMLYMYDSGIPPGEIAHKYGMTRDTIYAYLRKNGRKKHLPENDRIKRNKEILARVDAGESINDIAKDYDITGSMVRTLEIERNRKMNMKHTKKN